MNRAEKSEKTFDEAAALAAEHQMALTNPSDGCYQLRHQSRRWIWNLYPRRNGLSPRVYNDRNHRGPWLELPDNWTLLDAVKAAAEASQSEATK